MPPRSGLLPIWVVVMALLLLAGWQAWPRAQLAETDLLSLLPEAELADAEKAMLGRITTASGGTMLWLLEGIHRPVEDADVDSLRQLLTGSGLFQSVGADPAAVARTTRDLMRWRYHLLPSRVRELVTASPDNGRVLADARVRALLAPGGVAGMAGLKDDPFGFFQGWLLSWLPPDADVRQGALRTPDGGRILPAVLAQSGFNLQTQFRLDDLMSAAQHVYADTGLRLRIGGVPAYAARNAASARSEVSTVGTGSVIAIIILVLYSFRSLQPLVYTLIVIGCGIGAGAAISLLVFERIHLLTWVFGASLIGISIDYAVHVMATAVEQVHWSPAAGVSTVIRPTALGVGSSMLGFATLLLTPFPVLAEIATFAIAGLGTAWLSCMALATPLLARYRPPHHSPATRQAAALASLRTRLLRPGPTRIAVIVLCLPGLYLLEPDDRITALQAADTPVATDDAHIRTRLPTRFASAFFALEAASSDELLRLEAELTAQLRALDDQVRLYALSDLIAPAAEQRQALQALQAALDASGEGNRFFATIGYQPELGQAEMRRWQDATAATLAPATLAASLPPPWSLLWQGCGDGKCRSMVLLDRLPEPAALARITLPGVRVVDQLSLLSDRFAQFRAAAVTMLGMAILLVTFVLTAFFGARSALRIVSVPCLALLVAFAWLGYSGALYSVFNVFALLLVFGLGIDYAVFQHAAAAASTADTRRTELAILLSAITTLLAFGLLSLSSTTVIAAFGSTLTAGITACWLLSPLARPPARTSRP